MEVDGQKWRKISSRLIKSQATRLLKHQSGGGSYYRGRSHTQSYLTQGDRRETRKTEMIYEPQVRAAWSWCKLIRNTPKHVGWIAAHNGEEVQEPWIVVQESMVVGARDRGLRLRNLVLFSPKVEGKIRWYTIARKNINVSFLSN